ncbi:MAG: Xaa-Pro aminopeptidase [Gammaproteobacteria bacterium]|nr:Xaa-Pro aminopeptidase [Gammaproteobacteria bacterium]
MISMNEYAKRRKALMQEVGDRAIVILHSAPEISRNGDALYDFRQNSDFYYLTGFEEPEAVLVLAPHRAEGEYILFNRQRNKDKEIWHGPRAGQDGACSHFLANQSFPIEQFEELLPELLSDRESIHYPIGQNEILDQIILRAMNEIKAKIRGGMEFPTTFVDVGPSLHEMRLFKTPQEIKLMQRAVDISHEGHVRAMKACKPAMHEYELEAEFRYACFRQGARSTAYSSIVGAGKNSCVLHYVSNNNKIENGDLILIDAGAEYQNYASDITRTFPANGQFTKEQRQIYELVLASQLAAIKTIKPGESFLAAQHTIVEILTAGLVELGLLKGDVEELIEQQAYFPFYMHRSGHWLGLDVHDVGRYKINNKWRTLEPGMVLTVEPGLYIAADSGAPKRFHNIGVRIEDNVLVTEAGHTVLSQAIPKTIEEIEAIMAGAG